MYVQEPQQPSYRFSLAGVLVACIVISFGLAAISIAYTAGRQSGDHSRVQVAPPSVLIG